MTPEQAALLVGVGIGFVGGLVSAFLWLAADLRGRATPARTRRRAR